MSTPDSFSWPVACGSRLVNPYCIAPFPTDPYSWFLYNDVWRQALPYSSIKTYDTDEGAVYNGLIYVCTAGPCYAQTPGLLDNSWVRLAFLTPETPPLECDRVGGPLPNPESDACEKSALNGPEAACVNPCIRLSNGTLAVNKNVGQCRVFPSATEGGNATTVQGPSGAQQTCPTVCPSACVELYDTCPPGTAPLTTLIQTKNPIDVEALTGPYKLTWPGPSGPSGPSGPATDYDNPLFPWNYARYDRDHGTLVPPIGGKPYTECYSYNTSFCELPMAWQETVSGPPPTSPFGGSSNPITVCYAPCPQGTFQDPADPHVCLFVPLSGTLSPDTFTANYTPDTPVQKVFCNPQYFNPAYWDPLDWPGKGGIQKGCTAKQLPSKQGSTCPAGTSPIINENFNLEWCLPDCPQGNFSDLSYSSCIPTCQGAFASAFGIPQENTKSTTEYNKYLDYVFFYAAKYTCRDVSYSTQDGTVTVEVSCIQNYTFGRCVAEQRTPATSDQYSTILSARATTSPADVVVKSSSINRQCYDKLYREWLASGGTSGMPYSDYQSFLEYLENIRQYQEANPTRPDASSKFFGINSYTDCPIGMSFGNIDCGENTALCYDNCIEGYEQVNYCRNGATTCSNEERVYACRALCPGPDEGLGPWKPVNDPPLFTCEYQYPNGVAPTNPAAWATCPDDGRYQVLQSSAVGPISVESADKRKPPLCIRNTYLRHTTCGIGYNPYTDRTTGQTKCQAACNSGDAVMSLDDGTIVCQNVNVQNSRYEIDMLAVADSPNTKPEFRDRVLRRLNTARGLGLDPNIGLQNPQDTSKPNPWLNFLRIAGIVIGIIIGILILKSFVGGRKNSN